MGQKTLVELSAEWSAAISLGPQRDSARSKLLEEYVATGAELVACQFINELPTVQERNWCAHSLATKLIESGKANMVRGVLISISGVDARVRFAAMFDTYMATDDRSDLFIARAIADRLEPQAKEKAYLQTYRQTGDENDLFLAEQATNPVGIEHGFRTVPETQGACK